MCVEAAADPAVPLYCGCTDCSAVTVVLVATSCINDFNLLYAAIVAAFSPLSLPKSPA